MTDIKYGTSNGTAFVLYTKWSNYTWYFPSFHLEENSQ